MAHCPLFIPRSGVTMRRLMWAMLALVPVGRLPAQQSEEPVEFSAYAAG